jgi:hydrogenase maturation protease
VSGRCLIACIGNIFFADDGFGVEVARRLATAELPPEVNVVDYGIRGVHLAYDLLAGYEVTILVDAIDRGDQPGTVSVLDVTSTGDQLAAHPRQLDPHGMAPDAVLEHVATLGGSPGQVYVVGCQPATTDEGIGLSASVEAAIPTAVDTVLDLVATHFPGRSAGPGKDKQPTRTGGARPEKQAAGESLAAGTTNRKSTEEV